MWSRVSGPIPCIYCFLLDRCWALLTCMLLLQTCWALHNALLLLQKYWALICHACYFCSTNARLIPCIPFLSTHLGYPISHAITPHMGCGLWVYAHSQVFAWGDLMPPLRWWGVGWGRAGQERRQNKNYLHDNLNKVRRPACTRIPHFKYTYRINGSCPSMMVSSGMRPEAGQGKKEGKIRIIYMITLNK